MKKAVFILLLLAACAGVMAMPRKHKKKTPAGGRAIISATIHRTACFGRCPDYTIEINASGLATYTAIRFNADTGTFTKKIGAARAKEILDELAASRADTCKELYENRIPDLPGLNYVIKYSDTVKKIYCANWGPAFLVKIAKEIDGAGKKTDDTWTKVAP